MSYLEGYDKETQELLAEIKLELEKTARESEHAKKMRDKSQEIPNIKPREPLETLTRQGSQELIDKELKLIREQLSRISISLEALELWVKNSKEELDK
jgi:hypothetical protein